MGETISLVIIVDYMAKKDFEVVGVWFFFFSLFFLSEEIKEKWLNAQFNFLLNGLNGVQKTSLYKDV